MLEWVLEAGVIEFVLVLLVLGLPKSQHHSGHGIEESWPTYAHTAPP